jgi:uncharacterized protein (DUF3820 family)
MTDQLIPLSVLKQIITSGDWVDEDVEDLFMACVADASAKFYAESLCYKMPFGKYKGKTLIEVQALNPGYIGWMLEREDMEEKFADVYLALLEFKTNLDAPNQPKKKKRKKAEA